MELSPGKKRFVRIAAGVVIALVALLLITAIALRLFLPRERIRSEITKQLSNRLNQDVAMENVSVGFYPDAELVLKGVRIADRASSEELLSATHVRLDMRLSDLLKGKYSIDEITIDSPSLNLIRAEDGKWNIEKLLSEIQQPEEKTPREEIDKRKQAARVRVGPVIIKKGSIHISDTNSGQELNVKKIATTIDLEDNIIRLESAQVLSAPINASISGLVSGFAGANPFFDIDAETSLMKSGPLAGFGFGDLPKDARIADIALKIDGSLDKLAFNGKITPNPLAKGVPAKGTFSGVVRSKENIVELSEGNISFGQTGFSLLCVADNIRNDARTLRLEGTGTLALEEIIVLAGDDLLAKVEPVGVAQAEILLASTGERADLKMFVNLDETGFTLPDIMRKPPGTPGSISATASHTPTDDLLVDTFKFNVGDSQIDATGRIKKGDDPWAQASISASDLQLKNLDRLPSFIFEEGSLSLNADIWRASAEDNAVEYKGEARIENASLIPDALTKPIKGLEASISLTDKKAIIESANFSLAESTCRLEGEIIEYDNPTITGILRVDMLDLNKIGGAFRDDGEDNKKESSEPSGEKHESDAPGFSLEMIVEANSIYAGPIKAGFGSARCFASGPALRFDPIEAKVFEGTLKGSLQLDLSEEPSRWEADYECSNMRLREMSAQLLKGDTKFKGLFNAEGSLSGVTGPETQNITESLDGNMRIRMINGEIAKYAMLKNIFMMMQFGTALVPGAREVAILNTVIDAAKTRGESLNPTKITFDKIKGTFAINEGVAHTEDLRLESGMADLIFRGDIDIGQSTLDLRVTATPLGSVGSLMEKIPVAGGGIRKAKEATLSTDFIARGPISNPEVKMAIVEKVRGTPGNGPPATQHIRPFKERYEQP